MTQHTFYHARRIGWALLVFGWLPALVGAQAHSPKIDSILWSKVASGQKAECLVILKEQADLSESARFYKKADKGRFVHKTLSSLAQHTQQPLKQLLDAAQAPWLSFWIINALWTRADAPLLLQLAAHPAVQRLEYNPAVHMQLLPQSDSLQAPPAVQDRTFTANSWGLTKINADDVWNLGYSGSGVVVGGQDTGYEWQIPALKDKYRGWNGSSANHNYNWHDAIHNLIGTGSNSCGLNLTAPCDDNGHGTHTMGTMAGSESSGLAVGVAPDARWIGCRNMEEGDGTPATYIECFEWFVAPTNLSNGSPDPDMAPHVINNSWGCPVSEGCNSSNYATMETVVNNVRAAGIVVVVSAGNDGSACSTVNSPAAIYSGAFSVGSTTNTTNDAISGFSSRGPVNVYTNIKKPDIAAPGSGISSCIGNSNNAGTYTYSNLSGTSMAGPHVAGVVALVISARPDLAGQVSTIETLLKNSAIPRYPTSTQLCGGDNTTTLPNNVYGWGRVDALAAVTAAIALPVELSEFRVERVGSTARLFWRTLSESDCDYFEIQRSRDGFQWDVLDRRECQGADGGAYHFSDEQPEAGLNYYRLNQVDRSGAQAYSVIRTLAFSANGIALQVLQEAGGYQVRFRVAGWPQEMPGVLEIYSAEGKQVYQAHFMYQVMDVQDWAPGVYLVALKDERGVIQGRGKLIR
jgi:serine protease AprX